MILRFKNISLLCIIIGIVHRTESFVDIDKFNLNSAIGVISNNLTTLITMNTANNNASTTSSTSKMITGTVHVI